MQTSFTNFTRLSKISCVCSLPIDIDNALALMLSYFFMSEQNTGPLSIGTKRKRPVMVNNVNWAHWIEVSSGWGPCGDWLRPKEGKAAQSSPVPGRNTHTAEEKSSPLPGRKTHTEILPLQSVILFWLIFIFSWNFPILILEYSCLCVRVCHEKTPTANTLSKG